MVLGEVMAITPSSYKRVQHFNIPGQAHFLTFSTFRRLPLLTNEVWRRWLGASIRNACDEMRFELWAYVFMPEHLHLLVRPINNTYEIGHFLHAIKKPVAQRIIQGLSERRAPLLDKLAVGTGTQKHARFWQSGGGYDLNIWDEKKALEKARYCHNNPVLRGLVTKAEQWKWSSFRWLEKGQREAEPLALDSWSV